MLARRSARNLQHAYASASRFSRACRAVSNVHDGPAQDAAPSSRPLDKIHLQGMQFFGHHGVLPEETKEGQDFFVDAMLLLDLRPAGRTDDLTKTVNYADVFSDIEAILEGEPFQLIESVAEAVANTILRRYSLVHTAVIRIDKPHAPIDGDFGTVAVEVTRSQYDLG